MVWARRWNRWQGLWSTTRKCFIPYAGGTAIGRWDHEYTRSLLVASCAACCFAIWDRGRGLTALGKREGKMNELK